MVQLKILKLSLLLQPLMNALTSSLMDSDGVSLGGGAQGGRLHLQVCVRGASVSPQVIYKKFNITCPLQTLGNTSVSDLVPDDGCTTKYFTINQEVGLDLPDT